MSEHRYIACDLGAESGRVMLGRLADGRLSLEEVHRFQSPVVTEADASMRWDVGRIFEGLKSGLQKIASAGATVDSISVDSWGVDYVVIGSGPDPLWPPHHYRDGRTAEPYRLVKQRVGESAIFEATGVQFMPINTLYQLVADCSARRPALDGASAFLTIADYFNYRLSGVPVVDESNASTTQLFDPRTRQWSRWLMDACELPRHLFPKIVPPGTVLGPLLNVVADDVGFAAPPQGVATCSHDTGAAVAAVSATAGDDWAFLSSGTWSLLGVELPGPLINERVRAANFTNEAGYGGTTRFLKNIVGLWILQELRREWAARGRDIDYAELTELGRLAEPFRSLIHPNDARFLSAGGMVAKVVGYCRETNQPVPTTNGQFARCVLESLALLYRGTLDEMESLTGRSVRRIHVVGGGSRNTLLNQFTADATGREVIAGPVEASALGNVLVQAIALGHVATIAEARKIVRDSFPLATFNATTSEAWQTAFDRFATLRVAE